MVVGAILVETPYARFELDPSMVFARHSSAGMSGSHSAMLSIAMWFAKRNWNVSLASNIKGDANPLMPQLQYLRSGFKTEECLTSMYDVAIVPNIWSTLTGWDRCKVRNLVVVMENQLLDGPSCGRIYAYLKKFTDTTRPRLSLLHLSPWGESIYRKNAAGEAVMDPSFPMQKVMKLQMQRQCGFTLDSNVEHSASVFTNPLPIADIDAAARFAQERNAHSFIFPACQERGGIMTARAFKRLKNEWGPRARAQWAFYDEATKESAELQKILAAAGRGQHGEKTDPRVWAGVMSKPDLLQAMHESGFFLYGLVSSMGSVHYDTMGLAVAEALAAGVIVLAPRIAALPSLYEELVVWVQPPHGLTPLQQNATFMARDSSGLGSDAMVAEYIAAIHALLSDEGRMRKLRARGARAMRQRFSETAIMSKLEGWVESKMAAAVKGWPLTRRGPNAP